MPIPQEDLPDDDLVDSLCGMLTAAQIDPRSQVGSNLLLNLVSYITKRTETYYNFGTALRHQINKHRGT